MGRGGLWGAGGRLFEAARLLTFPASRMGAYSRWALIQVWALIGGFQLTSHIYAN